MTVLAGKTLDALLAGGSVHTKWVASIEGCNYLLSDATSSAVAAAYAGTPWDSSVHSNAQVLGESLFVYLQNEQKIDPWTAFGRGGKCTLRIQPDRTDAFGVMLWRRAAGAETPIGVTMDRSTTSVPVAYGSDFSAPPGEAFVGTECVKYSGMSTTMTVSQRGMYSPLKTGTGSLYFSEHHRVGNDPTQVLMDPLLTQQPRTWIGKWVTLRWHLWDGTSINSRDDALLAFCGKIVSIADDPNDFCAVIELRHILDVIADSVLFQDQYVGELTEAIYLHSTGVLKFSESLSGTISNANDGAIAAGYYSLSECIQLLNNYLAGELSAGRIHGYYTWGSPVQTSDGMRTVVHWTLPGTSGQITWFKLTLPSELAAFLGLTTDSLDYTGASSSYEVGGVADLGSVVAKAAKSRNEPYLSMAFQFGGPVGQFQAPAQNERGAWVNQRDLLPSGIKYITDGIEQVLYAGVPQNWGIFLLDEKVLCFGIYDPVNHAITNATVAPWALTGDQNHSLILGRKASDNSGPITIRQVLFLENSLANVLNYFFYSTGTTGFNHPTYDVLGPGMGVALPGEALGATWEASINALPQAQAPIIIILDEPTKVSDLFSSDLLLRLCFPVWKQGGLRMARWQTPMVGLASYTLDEDNKSEPAGNQVNHRVSTVEDSSYARPIIKIDWDHDFATGRDGQYNRSMSLEDQTAVDDAGGNGDTKQTATIQARNTFSAFAETGAAMPQLVADRLAHMPMLARPGKKIVRSIPLTLYEALAPGDIVIVNDTFARDPLTGTRGINNRAAMVTRVFYDPGGPTPAPRQRSFGQAAPGARPMAGEVELWFLDTHRGAEYGPAVDINETAAGAGYNPSGFSGHPELTVRDHNYSESGEATDRSHLNAGDPILITEIDPTNTAAPLQWQRTIVSFPTATIIAIDTALASPAWDGTKKYRITYPDYSACNAVQQDHAFQADTTDHMIEDTEIADHYASTHDISTFTLYSPSDKGEFLADSAYGDGKSKDVGNDNALARTLNLLIDRKCGHQAPWLATDGLAPSTVLNTWQTQYLGVQFLGTEQLSTSIYRYVTLAPWLRLDTANGASSGQVRVTVSRDLPMVSQGSIDDGTQTPYFTGAFTQLIWTTSSTTWATGGDQLATANLKDPYFGMVYITIETFNAFTRGLAKWVKGERRTA